MGTVNLTAEQALDEVLNHYFGRFAHAPGWRAMLEYANGFRTPDAWEIHPGAGVTYGDLRRWAAPLLATEG